jgi:hypothetical protein
MTERSILGLAPFYFKFEYDTVLHNPLPEKTLVVYVKNLELLVDFLDFEYGYTQDYVLGEYVPAAITAILDDMALFGGTGSIQFMRFDSYDGYSMGRYMIKFPDLETFTLMKLMYDGQLTHAFN